MAEGKLQESKIAENKEQELKNNKRTLVYNIAKMQVCQDDYNRGMETYL